MTLFCSASQWSSFYMIGTSVRKGINLVKGKNFFAIFLNVIRVLWFHGYHVGLTEAFKEVEVITALPKFLS